MSDVEKEKENIADWLQNTAPGIPTKCHANGPRVFGLILQGILDRYANNQSCEYLTLDSLELTLYEAQTKSFREIFQMDQPARRVSLTMKGCVLFAILAVVCLGEAEFRRLAAALPISMENGTGGPKVLDHFTEGRIQEICPPGMALDYRGSLTGETLFLAPEKVLLWLHDYPFAEAYLKEPPPDVFSLPAPGKESPEPEIWPELKENSTGTSNLQAVAVGLIPVGGAIPHLKLIAGLGNWLSHHRESWIQKTRGKMASAKSIRAALSQLKARDGINYDKETKTWRKR